MFLLGQVFIAVEYCARGSLDNILKDARSSFINLVRYGKLVDKLEQDDEENINR